MTDASLRLDPDAVVWRIVAGEVVALDLRSNRYLSVNVSGTVLWEAVARGTTEADLTSLLQTRWVIDEATARADVRRFVVWLRASRLLTNDAR